MTKLPKLTLTWLKRTPVFVLSVKDDEPWQRVWGAKRLPNGDWAFPAYFPFGMWSVSDLKVIYSQLEYDEKAQEQREKLYRKATSIIDILDCWKNGKSPLSWLPAGFQFHVPPFHHQELGISLAFLNWREFFLWEMGTGKTKVMIETFRILKKIGEFTRALVVAPPIVSSTWEQEIQFHAQGELSFSQWSGGELPQTDVVFVSYTRAGLANTRAAAVRKLLLNFKKLTSEEVKVLLKKINVPDYDEKRLIPLAKNPLEILDYDIIVADESHYLGNWRSDQTQATVTLSAGAARRYALTGTAGDQPLKYFSQLFFLAPGLMPMNYETFWKSHVTVAPGSKHRVIGYRHMDKINDKVDRIASRMKKLDCLDLPPVTISDILFDLGSRQVERYNEIVREMQISFTEDDLPKFALLPHGAARVTKLLQLTSGFVIKGKDYSICNGCAYISECVASHTRPFTPGCDRAKEAPPDQIIRDMENVKLDIFEGLIENILTSDDTNKIICWGCFLPELDDMEEVCKRRGWKHIRIDGKSSRNIKKLQEKFQKDPDVRVCVGEVASGIGINLTAANYVIYYSLPWDRLQYDQSKDRNHRPGQDRPVTVYRLLAKGTLAVFLAALLQFKSKIAYTLSEKITCSVCSDQERCAKQQIHPFHKGCKYQSEVSRPIAKAEEL